MPFTLVCCQLRFCFVLFFLHLCYYYLFFKAANLDGHMAFLVAVHYVIFYWKFCMQVWTINSSSSLHNLLSDDEFYSAVFTSFTS